MLRLLAAVGLFAVSLYAGAGEPARVNLSVQGMYCAACPITVRKALEAVPGVKSAVIDFRTKVATVQYDPEKVTPERLAHATANAGFPSTVVSPKS